MSGLKSRGSVGAYQADERAGVNPYSPKDFVARGGIIPAPLHSLKN